MYNSIVYTYVDFLTLKIFSFLKIVIEKTTSRIKIARHEISIHPELVSRSRCVTCIYMALSPKEKCIVREPLALFIIYITTTIHMIRNRYSNVKHYLY